MTYLNERNQVTGLFVTPLHSQADQIAVGINSGTDPGMASALLAGKARNDYLADMNKRLRDENDADRAKKAGSPSGPPLSAWAPKAPSAPPAAEPAPPPVSPKPFPKGVLWMMALGAVLWAMWASDSWGKIGRWGMGLVEARENAERLAKFSDFSKPSEWPAAERALLATGPAAGSLEALMVRRAAFPPKPKPADFERLGASVWGLLAPMGVSAQDALAALDSLKIKGVESPRVSAVGLSLMFLQSRCWAGVEPACLDLARFHASKLAGGPKAMGSKADAAALDSLKGVSSPAAKELAARIGG
jgi:hypothetical protein